MRLHLLLELGQRLAQRSNGVLSGSDTYKYPSCDSACQAPRHYQYVIRPGEEKLLKQNPVETELFNVTVPDSGRAIARAVLVFRSNSTADEYGWVARIVVGSGAQEDDIAYGYQAGEDLCPLQSSGARSVAAYGQLGGVSPNTVSVVAYSTRFGGVDDMVSVNSGSYLDVWVEDPRPQCIGKDISATSYYHVARKERGWSNFLDRTFTWPTSVAPIIGLDLVKNAGRQNLKVITTAVGGPKDNPTSQCGAEVATMTSQQKVGGNIAAYATRVLPPS